MAHTDATRSVTAEPAPIDPAAADDILRWAVLGGDGHDDAHQDPYPSYALLRARSPRWHSSTGATVLTRYKDCLDALRHPHLGRPEADMELGPSLAGRAPRRLEDPWTMLLLNPPDHTRIRGLVSREFTPRRVESLRPRLRGLMEAGMDRLADGGGGDVMSELAIPFPVAVISELLGVPAEGNEHIRPLVRDMTGFIDAASDDDTLARAAGSAMTVAAYFVELIEEKRRSPDDGLLSALIRVEEEGDRLSTEELLANTVLLYAAGFETTSNLIGNGLLLLLRHPEQMQRLRDEPGLLHSAVWEMLRHDSPIQLNGRSVLEEVELFGEVHPRGTQFTVLQGCANHDEAVYRDAERFDVTRFADEAPPPLSFGWGAHHCLGAHLARAEGEILFGALIERFSAIDLDTSALPGGRPVFRPSFTFRGLESLPVTVTGRTGG